MFVHEAPYLHGLHGGAQLRTEMTKIQNYAELNAMHGGTFGTDVFVPFLNECSRLTTMKSGTPDEGLFLGMGIKDPRPLVYKVLSAMRLQYDVTNDIKGIQMVNDFFTSFIHRWEAPVPPLKFTTDLPATITIDGTASLSVAVEGGTAPYKYTWARNGQVVQGATTAKLDITQAGEYQVVVVDAEDKSISSAKCTATVKEEVPPATKNGV